MAPNTSQAWACFDLRIRDLKFHWKDLLGELILKKEGECNFRKDLKINLKTLRSLDRSFKPLKKGRY